MVLFTEFVCTVHNIFLCSNSSIQYVWAMRGSVCRLKTQLMSGLIQCAQSTNSTQLIVVDWVTKWISDTDRETLYHTDHFTISKWQTHHFHAVIDFEDSWPFQCIYLENQDFKYIWEYNLIVASKNMGQYIWLLGRSRWRIVSQIHYAFSKCTVCYRF